MASRARGILLFNSLAITVVGECVRYSGRQCSLGQPVLEVPSVRGAVVGGIAAEQGVAVGVVGDGRDARRRLRLYQLVSRIISAGRTNPAVDQRDCNI